MKNDKINIKYTEEFISHYDNNIENKTIGIIF